MPRQKNYCFTINNYTSEDLADLENFKNLYLQYLEFSFETGESGTPHIQGFFILKKESSMKSIKQCGLPRAHLSVMRGSILENKDYCSKESETIKWGQEQVSVPNLEAVMLLLSNLDWDFPDIVKFTYHGREPTWLVEETTDEMMKFVHAECPIQYIRHYQGIRQYILHKIKYKYNFPLVA